MAEEDVGVEGAQALRLAALLLRRFGQGLFIAVPVQVHTVLGQQVFAQQRPVQQSLKGRIGNVQFEGACRGNTQGVAALAEGLPAREVAARLKGIDFTSVSIWTEAFSWQKRT